MAPRAGLEPKGKLRKTEQEDGKLEENWRENWTSIKEGERLDVFILFNTTNSSFLVGYRR